MSNINIYFKRLVARGLVQFSDRKECKLITTQQLAERELKVIMMLIIMKRITMNIKITPWSYIGDSISLSTYD